MRPHLIAGALLAALALAPAALAETSWFLGDIGMDEVQQGMLLFPAPEKPGRYHPARGLETAVTARLTGVMARVEVRQRFVNHSPSWQEATYVFPLPPGAAVDTMRVEVGDRVLVGEIQTKEAAKKTYEVAKREGKKAALVEQARPDVFTTSVANVGPGEAVTVVIEYLERLRWQDGRFSWRFPMTLDERFRPGPATSGSGAAVRAEAEVPTRTITDDLDQGPTVKLEVDLDALFPLASVRCDTHPVEVEEAGPTTRRIRLADGEVPAFRDLVLEWAPALPDAPLAAVRVERRGGAIYALLMLQPPRPEAVTDQRLDREALLVVDSSGSMKGPRMDQARVAVADGLGRLKPSDHFNVIDFDSKASAVFPTSRAAQPAHLDDARAFVEGLRADGGTNISAALDLALGAPPVEGLLRQVVFITDGQIDNEAQLFQQIRRQLGKARLFTVGIGDAPNVRFMAGAARHGRGSFVQIDHPDKVRSEMERLFAKLETPVVRDLAVSWGGSAATTAVEAWPKTVPDLYVGEPLVVLARLGDAVDAVRTAGRSGGDAFEVSLPLPEEDRPGVARLWAREKIAALQDSLALGADRNVVRKQVTATALEYGLVSDFTSLVAVDKTPSRPEGEALEKTDVKSLLPADRAKPKRKRPAPVQGVPEPEEWAMLLLTMVALTHLTLAERAARENG